MYQWVSLYIHAKNYLVFPQDLTGGNDGSLRMWEFGHEREIASYREAGKFQRVTKVHFSQHGSKVSAWHLARFHNGDQFKSFYDTSISLSGLVPVSAIRKNLEI